MTEKHHLLSNLADWTGLSNHSQVTLKKRTDTRGGEWCVEGGLLTVKVLLLRSAHFMRGGFAHSLADSRPGHAVLSCCDPIRDRLARHRTDFFLSPPSISENSTITIRSMDQLNVTSLSSGGNRTGIAHTHTQTHTVFHTTCAAMSAHDRYKNNLFNYNLNLKLKQKMFGNCLFRLSIYAVNTTRASLC